MRSTGFFLLGVALATSVGCASSPKHEPFASENCQGTCETGIVAGGGDGGSGSGGTSSPLLDGGVGAVAQPCTTDPGSGQQYCPTSASCPGVEIDPVLFVQCGFLPGAALDVECICNGNQLCPIQVGTTCAKVASQLTILGSRDTVCLQISNAGVCRDISNIAGGAGGAAGCNQDCLATCSGVPGCPSTCGCGP